MNKTDEIVILPPYVAPEHRKMIDDAENMLSEYNEILLNKLKLKLFDPNSGIRPHPVDVRAAEIQYHNDPTRQLLLKQLMNIKLFCERHRFMVKDI